MNESIVYEMVGEIYATFQKTPPKRDSRIVEKLVESLEDVPDRVASYIETKVTQNNNLPTNLIKACRDAWDSYCQAHPTASASGPKCPYCYGNGGWNYFRPDWPMPFWSYCPHCTPQNEATRLTPRQLMDKGYTVVPSNYHGGLERFRQVEILGWTPEGQATIPPAIQRVQPGYGE
jgi:hypothetical protein